MKYYKSKESFLRRNKEEVFGVIPHATDDEAEALLGMFHDMIQVEGEKAKREDAILVLDIFNQVRKEYWDKDNLGTYRGLKPVKTNLKQITPRLNDGESVEDMALVIQFKFQEWWGTKWQAYLRPSTLFNSEKYPGYKLAAETWCAREVVASQSKKSLTDFKNQDGFAY